MRVLVLSGAGGKAFVSGADISKFESQRANAADNEVYAAKSAAAYEGIYNFPKPTIAKIQGYCIGGGMNLAICCDMRVATSAKRLKPAFWAREASAAIRDCRPMSTQLFVRRAERSRITRSSATSASRAARRAASGPSASGNLGKSKKGSRHPDSAARAALPRQ